jgi:hypothetical protein
MQYIALIRRRMSAIRKDLPALIRLGGRMARHILDGGNLFPAEVAEFWPTEFTHRAGGLMGTKRKDYKPTSDKDVAFFALPGDPSWDPARDDTLQRLIRSKARLFAIGRRDRLRGLKAAGRFAGFTGGARMHEGLYAFGSVKPLAPLWQFDHLVRGWLTTGEMIAACTRAGKTPAIWMSVWLEGAYARNYSFIQHDNLTEPWHPPMFHKKRYVPPLTPGCVSHAFLAELDRIVAGLVAQQTGLAKAGAWMAQAVKGGRKVHVVAVGHSYPKLLDLPKDAPYPVDWGWSRSDLSKAVPAGLGRGDVAVHLGYSPVNVTHVGRILGRGILFIYTSPYGRPTALKSHRNLLWLDLPWRPGDATVDVPGYSVRILPLSSSAHTVAYFAMLCEMAYRLPRR